MIIIKYKYKSMTTYEVKTRKSIKIKLYKIIEKLLTSVGLEPTTSLFMSDVWPVRHISEVKVIKNFPKFWVKMGRLDLN